MNEFLKCAHMDKRMAVSEYASWKVLAAATMPQQTNERGPARQNSVCLHQWARHVTVKISVWDDSFLFAVWFWERFHINGYLDFMEMLSNTLRSMLTIRIQVLHVKEPRLIILIVC
jgi:hypothetical protein